MAKKQTYVRRVRPELHTKEELIEYLESNPDKELPLVEELWEKCVELAKKDSINGKKTVSVVVDNEDGTSVVRKSTATFWSDNPVKWYFKQAGLSQWQRKGNDIVEEMMSEPLETEHQQKIESNFEEELVGNYADELIVWINKFQFEERTYLKKRYVHYYDCYEINEGADKTTLKRILSLEIGLNRIDNKRAVGGKVDNLEEEKLTKQLTAAFESMKWTKKQRNARDEMAQNKFTVWLQDASKEDEFKPKPRVYEKDELDFLLETYIDSAREMMN